jgi:hypothetical protein
VRPQDDQARMALQDFSVVSIVACHLHGLMRQLLRRDVSVWPSRYPVLRSTPERSRIIAVALRLLLLENCSK